MADVFLSYAHADAATADQVAAALGSLEWDVWWDRDIRAGEYWSDTIDAEAQRARCVVVLWSQTSVQRPWVLQEAEIGAGREVLIPVVLDRGLKPPARFEKIQYHSLATWDGTRSHPEFRRLVDDLWTKLGGPPKAIPDSPPHPQYANEELSIRKDRPATISEFGSSLPRNGKYFESPEDWKEEVLYLLIPDRFSDGDEDKRPPLDRSAMRQGGPAGAGVVRLDAWARSGLDRWQGGRLAGVASKLDYLQGLGVTTVWLWPVLKQRAGADTYHGWAPQDFLDVDPRLGGRWDLVDLVAQAHHRQMRVILSGELHHSGMNWIYGEGAGECYMAPYTAGRHSFGAWLGADERPVSKPEGRDDGVWPSELQDPGCYVRAGSGTLGASTADEEGNEDAEFRRSDFFTLRTFDLGTTDPAKMRTLQALAACHRYWLALTDCDGLFLDCGAQLRRNVLDAFCRDIRGYAEQLGKHNFLVFGEVFGSAGELEKRYDRIGRELHGGLSAILDNGPMRLKLHAVAKGLAPASEWFAGYDESADKLGQYRALGRQHVSILDDPDGVFGSILYDPHGVPRPKLRFAFDAEESQIVVALAIQLFSLGIPCIYYGTEQAFGHCPGNPPPLPPECHDRDVYLREAMFGPEHPRRAGLAGLPNEPGAIDPGLPGFGPFETAGHHAFVDTNPLYQKIAGLTATRRKHAALRTGDQYQRQVASGGGRFEFPRAGELVAWSRILGDEEVLCVVNPNRAAEKRGSVVVDSTLNREGTALRVVFASGATEFAAAGAYREGTAVQVLRDEGGTAYLEFGGIPAGGVVVLSNRAK